MAIFPNKILDLPKNLPQGEYLIWNESAKEITIGHLGYLERLWRFLLSGIRYGTFKPFLSTAEKCAQLSKEVFDRIARRDATTCPPLLKFHPQLNHSIYEESRKKCERVWLEATKQWAERNNKRDKTIQPLLMSSCLSYANRSLSSSDPELQKSGYALKRELSYNGSGHLELEFGKHTLPYLLSGDRCALSHDLTPAALAPSPVTPAHYVYIPLSTEETLTKEPLKSSIEVKQSVEEAEQTDEGTTPGSPCHQEQKLPILLNSETILQSIWYCTHPYITLKRGCEARLPKALSILRHVLENPASHFKKPIYREIYFQIDQLNWKPSQAIRSFNYFDRDKGRVTAYSYSLFPIALQSLCVNELIYERTLESNKPHPGELLIHLLQLNPGIRSLKFTSTPMIEVLPSRVAQAISHLQHLRYLQLANYRTPISLSSKLPNCLIAYRGRSQDQSHEIWRQSPFSTQSWSDLTRSSPTRDSRELKVHLLCTQNGRTLTLPQPFVQALIQPMATPSEKKGGSNGSEATQPTVWNTTSREEFEALEWLLRLASYDGWSNSELSQISEEDLESKLIIAAQWEMTALLKAIPCHPLLHLFKWYPPEPTPDLESPTDQPDQSVELPELDPPTSD